MYNPKIDNKVIILLISAVFVAIVIAAALKSEQEKKLEIKVAIQKELDYKKQQKDAETARIEKERELKKILLLPGCDLKTPEDTIKCYYSSLKSKNYIQMEWCWGDRASGAAFDVECKKEYKIISKKNLKSAYIMSYDKKIILKKPVLIEIKVKNRCKDGSVYEEGRNLHLHLIDNKWYINESYSNDPSLD